MKILFPVDIYYPASVGGPSNALYWHTSFINSKGLEVYIVTTDRKIKENSTIEMNKWQYNKAGNIIYCKIRFGGILIRPVVEIIKKLLIVDVVHYSSAYSKLTIFTIFVSVLFRRKIFLSPRGEFFPIAIDNFLKKIVLNLYKLISQRITFHATSNEEYITIEKVFPKSKIVVQPNFIDIETSEKSIVNSKNIVFLGIIYSVKKIENLIASVFQSHNFMNSKSQLLIAGAPLSERDFLYKKKLEELIDQYGLSDKVKFVGELFDDEKRKFLNDAYILVLPSESENFGNVITEALSQSTPAIASTGTPWKILKDKKVGWWVDNDPESLKKAIEDALSLTESEYLNKCKESLQLVKEKFIISTSPDNCWIKLYTDS